MKKFSLLLNQSKNIGHVVFGSLKIFFLVCYSDGFLEKPYFLCKKNFFCLFVFEEIFFVSEQKVVLIKKHFTYSIFQRLVSFFPGRIDKNNDNQEKTNASQKQNNSIYIFHGHNDGGKTATMVLFFFIIGRDLLRKNGICCFAARCI